MKNVQRYMAAVLAAVMMFAATVFPTYASEDESHLEELQEEDAQKAEEEYAANQELQETQQKVNEVIETVRQLDENISEVVAEIADLDAEIEQNLALLEQTKKELEAAKDNEALWYQKLKLRIKAVYESGEINYLEVLLRAGSMSELFSKAEYSRELAEYDQEILDQLGAAKEQVQLKQEQVEEEEAILEENRASEEAKKEELQAVKSEKEEELAALEEDQAALELYTQQLRQQRENLAAEMAETAARIEEARRKAEEEAARKAAAEEAAKKAADEAARQAAEQAEKESAARAAQQEQSSQQEESSYEEEETYEESTPTYSGGGMVWPLPGYSRLSTYFMVGGHRGIDIPAPSGTPILAAASGTVIKSQWNSSYGYYVAISHGNGMVTLYAHSSQLLVSVGDTVSAGQPVCLCGTTGNSTGNHLHFEVQINGSLYNPLNYVSP